MTLYESLLLLLVGALLGKVLDIYIQKKRVSTFEKALLEELEDIKQRLKWICRGYEQSIQIFAQGGFDNAIPLRISNPLFKKHYSEVAIKLRSSQRKSFSLIDSYVDNVNKGISRLEAVHAKVTRSNALELLDDWGDLLKSQYMNAASAYWHVNYHLKNSDLPFLGDEDLDVHQAYVEQVQASEKHIQNLIEVARGTSLKEGSKD